MENIIQKLYGAFSELDADKMAACYHDDIVFEDPAFGQLKGVHAGNMWRMLCQSQKGKEFIVTASDIVFEDNKGSAHWEAKYNFSKTNRKVHNKIDAKFEIKDGLIIKHSDHFDLHNWAKQAMGFKGFLLGGTSFFKKKLNTQTKSLLEKFEQSI